MAEQQKVRLWSNNVQRRTTRGGQVQGQSAGQFGRSERIVPDSYIQITRTSRCGGSRVTESATDCDAEGGHCDQPDGGRTRQSGTSRNSSGTSLCRLADGGTSGQAVRRVLVGRLHKRPGASCVSRRTRSHAEQFDGGCGRQPCAVERRLSDAARSAASTSLVRLQRHTAKYRSNSRST